MTDLTQLPATEISARVRAKQLSPVEVVEAALKRVNQVDPELHAFVELTAERALTQAAALADKIAHGEDPGPLA